MLPSPTICQKKKKKKRKLIKNNELKHFVYLIEHDPMCKFYVVGTFTKGYMHKLLLCNSVKKISPPPKKKFL